MRTTEALRLLAAERRETYESLTRGREGTEDRIRRDVAAFRAAARDFDDTDEAGGVDGPEDATIDIAQLPDLRLEMVTVLTDLAAARDRADAACAAARDRLTGIRTAIERWRGWRADVAEAATHAAQQVADADAVRELARADTVATLSGALGAWRAASDQLTALDVERARLGAAVEAAWVDGYDRAALDGPTSATGSPRH